VAGAGFEKEHFLHYLTEKQSTLAKKTRVENTGSNGRSAIAEVLKRDVVKKIGDEANAARDIRLLDKLLEHVGKDTGLGVYGLSEIKTTADYGAIETLVVSDSFFLEKRGELEKTMASVKDNSGVVHLINHESEAGEQLSSLGGIAAILRFKVDSHQN